MDRVHKGGAKFDFEKAKWFNHEWIKRNDVQSLKPLVRNVLEGKGVKVNDDTLLEKVIVLVKDRCTLLTDFYEQSKFFFETPKQLDLAAIQPKWNADKEQFFKLAAGQFESLSPWIATDAENVFKNLATVQNIKPGEVLMPLRVMLVGGKFGPGVFDIAETIGKQETIHRINNALGQLAGNAK
jgi:glutamyl-tRNA synthetase